MSSYLERQYAEKAGYEDGGLRVPNAAPQCHHHNSFAAP